MPELGPEIPVLERASAPKSEAQGVVFESPLSTSPRVTHPHYVSTLLSLPPPYSLSLNSRSQT